MRPLLRLLRTLRRQDWKKRCSELLRPPGDLMLCEISEDCWRMTDERDRRWPMRLQETRSAPTFGLPLPPRADSSGQVESACYHSPAESGRDSCLDLKSAAHLFSISGGERGIVLLRNRHPFCVLRALLKESKALRIASCLHLLKLRIGPAIHGKGADKSASPARQGASGSVSFGRGKAHLLSMEERGTYEMCTPSPRCTPLHSRQMKVP